MKKIVIALVCVTSFSVFADRYGYGYGRHHDRRGYGRPMSCTVGMYGTFGRLKETFVGFGRDACQEAMYKCDRIAERTRWDLRPGHARCAIIGY